MSRVCKIFGRRPRRGPERCRVVGLHCFFGAGAGTGIPGDDPDVERDTRLFTVVDDGVQVEVGERDAKLSTKISCVQFFCVVSRVRTHVL